MRSRLAFRERVLASAIRVWASRLSSMLAILPLLTDKFPINAGDFRWWQTRSGRKQRTAPRWERRS